MSSLADRTVDELRVSRRQWKAAITRHLGSLKRAVAEDDVTTVKERLDKMKLSFNELEAVHIDLTGRINTDEDIAESDNWYAVVEHAYIVGVTDAHTWLRSYQATNVHQIQCLVLCLLLLPVLSLALLIFVMIW